MMGFRFKYDRSSVSLGEQDNSQGSSHSFGGKVVSESGQDSASVPVGCSDSSPNSCEPAPVLSDIHHSLSEVPCSVCSVSNSFQPQNSLFLALPDQ